jgi:23S rRNA (uracil1939-C5)-methyltransferase
VRLRKEIFLEKVRLGKLVHGGQCLGETETGKKILVWGGLPGELVHIRVTKKKRSYLEGIVTDVIEPSPDRIEPNEPLSYLSTSPWQIMTFDAENVAKQAILEETFVREGVENIVFEPFVAGASGRAAHDQIHSGPGAMRNPKGVSHEGYRYRNKMEFGFWGNDDGLHLAHYVRGTSGKQIVDGSALGPDCINEAARQIRDQLRDLDVWAGKLKTVMLRCSQGGEVVATLFMKERVDMSAFTLPEGLKGIDIYYSDPKSPASVPTKKLYSLGDIKLVDSIIGINITYDVLSFFQVNLPVFELALTAIKQSIKTKNIVDMYSGVGTIGIATGATTLVESDGANIEMAKVNVKGTLINVVHATSETAMNQVTSDCTLIVDPPRAGLHKNVIEQIIEIKPQQIVYLSCNPSTQARDIKLLEENYNIVHAQGFNFFPRTPHIESLIVLELK